MSNIRDFSKFLNILIITSLGFLISGCHMAANLEELLSQIQKPKSLIKIHDKEPYVLVNATNYAQKTITGSCAVANGNVEIWIDGSAVGTVPCTNSTWTWTHDFTTTPDADNIALEVSETDAEAAVTKDTATILKDTVVPQIVGLANRTIPQATQNISWSCLDPNDLCQFRFQNDVSPAFVFLTENFSTAAGTSITSPGIRYLYVQAQDKAQNLSTAAQLQIYVGSPQIFIAGVDQFSTSTGTVNLNLLAAPSLVEMALFNNQTCSGTANWIPTTAYHTNWALDAASQNGEASVSVKFRNSALEESACAFDTIQWITIADHTMCTDAGASTSWGRLVDSGGTNADYSNDENCSYNLTLSGPAKISFDFFETEGNYDILTILEDGVEILEHSGMDAPVEIETTGNNIQFNFTSDGSVLRPGFEIRWAPAVWLPVATTPSLSLNGGASGTGSQQVSVTLNPPSSATEVYLTENPSCSADGNWQPLASAKNWTFTDINDGTKTLYARFRNAFASETFCVSASIEYITPEILIDYPGLNEHIGNYLDVEGSCSIPGLTVQVSGTYSGTTTCDNDGWWYLGFDTSSLANNTTVAVTASLLEGTTVLASDSQTAVIKRTLSIEMPNSNSIIGPNATFQGYCNVDGTVNITSPVLGTTLCDDGSWSIDLTNIPGADSSTVTLTAQLVVNNVVQDTKSATYTLSTLPPTVLIAGAPTGVSTETSISLGFNGTNVTKVRYKIGNSADCADSSGYSAAINAPATQVVSIAALNNGNITVCAIGQSDINGLWQTFANASTTSWTKDSDVFANIASKHRALPEGTANVSLEFSLSGTKNYDVQVNYSTFGNSLYLVDHNLAPGSVTIPAGQLTASVNFNLLENVFLGDRELRIFVSYTDKEAVRIGDQNLTTILIKDNDTTYRTPTKISFQGTTYCMLYTDKTVWCHAYYNNYGILGQGHNTDPTLGLYQIPLGEGALDIAIGSSSGCALTESKRIACWGANSYGQLGNGNNIDQYSPVYVQSSQVFEKLAFDGQTGCAIDNNKKLFCWGYNTSGTVGDSTTVHQNIPVPIDPLTNYLSVAGSYTMCGITDQNKAKCWGSNYARTIDSVNNDKVLVPTEVDASENYLKILGGGTVCGINSNNKLKCWGGNYEHTAGVNVPGTVANPTIIDGSTNYQDLVSGCALTADNDLKCWGPVKGVFSAQQTTITPTPQPANDGIKYKSIAGGAHQLCGISTSDDIVCAGDSWNSRFYLKEVVQLAQIDPHNTVKEYSVGSSSYCGINSNNQAFCQGYGAGAYVSTPAVVLPDQNFSTGRTMASEGGTCVINSSGTLYCQGQNTFGAVGDGTSNNSVEYLKPIAPGVSFALMRRGNHSCAFALSTAGKLYGWSQCTGVPGNSNVPVMLDTTTTYKTDFLIGNGIACAITVDGDLKCLGYDDGYGYIGGVTRQTMTVMDAGTTYQYATLGSSAMCGLTTAGLVRCWGKNDFGQLANGGGATSHIPVASGGSEKFIQLDSSSGALCAINENNHLKCWGKWGDWSGSVVQNNMVAVQPGTKYLQIAMTDIDSFAIAENGDLHYWEKSRFDLNPTVLNAPTKFKSVKGNRFYNKRVCAVDTADKLWCMKNAWDGTHVNTPRFLPLRIEN